MFGQQGKRMSDEMEERPKTANSEGFLSKRLCLVFGLSAQAAVETPNQYSTPVWLGDDTQRTPDISEVMLLAQRSCLVHRPAQSKGKYYEHLGPAANVCIVISPTIKSIFQENIEFHSFTLHLFKALWINYFKKSCVFFKLLPIPPLIHK